MNFGLIGTGFWARRVHAAAACAHTGVNFVGVWGRNYEKARELARDNGVAAFEDLDDLLSAADVVGLAVPPGVQATLALRAARAGKHLLLEKPVAVTSELADELERVVAANSLASVVFFTARFIPEFARWFSDLANEDGWECGRVELLSSAMTSDSGFQGSSWRSELGALWDLGPHAISMLHAVLGDVESVGAMRGVRDQVHLSLRHAGGTSSTVSTSITVAEGAANGLTCYFYGRPGRRYVPKLDPATNHEIAAYRCALDCLLGQATSGLHDDSRDVRLGAHVVRILQAAVVSIDSGAVTRVPKP